jgi:hypothetical protein
MMRGGKGGRGGRRRRERERDRERQRGVVASCKVVFFGLSGQEESKRKVVLHRRERERGRGREDGLGVRGVSGGE